MDANHELIVHVASYHADREAGFNEDNAGLGIRLRSERMTYAAGFFRNSYFRQSIYAGIGARVFESNGLSFTVIGGAVTGYQHDIDPLVLPELGLRWNSFGVLLNYIPETRRTREVAAVSFSTAF